jgi:glutamine synthetase
MPSPPPAVDPADELLARGVESAALTFVDNAGVARAKCVPVRRLAAAMAHGVGASTTFGAFQGDDGMAATGGLEVPTGDLRLVPDLASLSAGATSLAWVAADQHDQDGRPWPICPRQFLRRMVERTERAGLAAQMAFEIEWHAEDAAGRLVHEGPGYGLAAVARARPYLEEVLRALAAHGVEVEQFHAEYSPGQLELSTSPAAPLVAADRSVLVRHVIRSAETATGLRASFSPLVGPGLLGNGCHLHVSLWRDGENALGSGPDVVGLTPHGRAFLAGVLAELPALVAVGCASPLSYRRLGPSRWTGAFACWGVENREAPLRLVRGSASLRPGGANAELKVVDASGNPYLVAGALLAAGLAGVAAGAELPPEVTVDPATLPIAERERLGAAPLPADLDAAAAALEASTTLRDALGAPLHRALVGVRRGEASSAASRGEDDLMAFYRWRY